MQRTKSRVRAWEARYWEPRLVRLILGLGRITQAPDGRVRPIGVLRLFQLVATVKGLGHRPCLVRPTGVLRDEVVPFGGRPLPLRGEPPVRGGERVIALHLDVQNTRRALAQIPDKQRLTFTLSSAAAEDLRVLQAMVRAGAFPTDVRVLWAETVLSPMLARLGFSTRLAPRGPRTSITRLYMLGLLAIYAEDGLSQATGKRQHHLRLGHAWLTLGQLETRFG